MPTVTLEAAGSYEHDLDAVRGERRDLTVLVKANWNLFYGLATKAGVAKAAHDRAAAQNDSRQVRREIEEQAKIAWETLRTARERVALLENAVNIATAVHESRQKLRAAGKENVINVLDAENEVYGTRINLASASFDARLAAYQVLLVMGQLDMEKVASLSREGEPLAMQVPDAD